MTKPRRHELISNDRTTHLVVTMPVDDAAALMMILVEKFGFAEVKPGQLERADGAKVSRA